MRPYLESIYHVTGSQPYALYHADFAPGESPVLLLHWHPEAEFFYLQDGTLLFLLEQEKITLTAGEAIFIPPRLLHTAHAFPDQGGQLRALVFSTDIVAVYSDEQRYAKYVLPMMNEDPHGYIHFRMDEPTHQVLLNDLSRLFKEADACTAVDLLTEGFIRILWQQMWRLHPGAQIQESASVKASSLVQRTIVYIHNHYAEDITLAQLAEEVHLTPAYLCRLFRKKTGIPPFAYLNRYRIMKSCEMLMNSDSRISEISSLCGFNNISYFNREFMKITHTTPSVYRRR